MSEGGTTATCHCGAVSIALAQPPAQITDCNCSFCRTHGVLWAYYPVGETSLPAATDATASYAWNGRHVDFHWCRTCGCMTHWVPRDASRTRRGINARLLPPEVAGAARIRHRDGAGSGDYLD